MIEPDIKWAVYPWYEDKVVYIRDLCDSSCTLPSEGDLIIRPCLIDPETREPIPVRVVEIRKYSEINPQALIFVVAPADAIN
ncbi:hypothetical protein [Nitrosomonas communis]|jgi:hypothetical protein|uniref:Uncharacterized protein n=1 Tax=Nitrosomonas communis TaxID=44574 RepID=A0A1I4WTY4_9PROT|nr:hypothetical protein [Nitrosomonas communis]SFN16439.1 hypothetical protein SAMN05421863_11184 [Nitrosomonas communis]